MSVTEAIPGTPDLQDITPAHFLQNTWYVAGWAADLPASQPRSLSVADQPIVLYRTAGGRLVALADRCPHRWAPLSLGRVEGEDLRCMYHGLKFAPDGHCVEIPGQARIPRSLCARSYPVREKHRLIWLWLGDPGLCDPDQIPNLSLLDAPAMRVYTGQLDYQAHYALINDNLLDLSHLAFLHANTLGRPVENAADLPPPSRFGGGSQAKAIERGVRVEGWLSGNNVMVPRRVRGGDFWSRVDFLVPGLYVSHGLMYPPGEAQRCAGAPPTAGEPLSDSFSIQAVTPMGPRHTRYFYSLGARTDDMSQAEADELWEIVLQAFCEDLRMIEAQQHMIDAHPQGHMGGVASDRGLALFRNLMRRLLAEEAAARSPS